MPNRALTGALVTTGALLAALAGCDDADSHGPDFSACADTPALIYTPGLTQTSDGGGFTAAVNAVVSAGGPGSSSVDAPAIGLGTWTIAITQGAEAAMNLTVTADKPRMPIHGHGASTFPEVTPQDGGVYVVSKINFFMAGYWEMALELHPAEGASDRIAFPICIPQ
jgi:hypothetical protein